MTTVRIASAAALSLVLAAPSIAYDGHGTQGQNTKAFRAYHDMRAQDALHFGRMDIYPRYHSGWGGPYGDGNYPGTIDDNVAAIALPDKIARMAWAVVAGASGISNPSCLRSKRNRTGQSV
jgi:hypothetical protein